MAVEYNFPVELGKALVMQGYVMILQGLEARLQGDARKELSITRTFAISWAAISRHCNIPDDQMARVVKETIDIITKELVGSSPRPSPGLDSKGTKA